MNASLKADNCLICAPAHSAEVDFYFIAPHADLASVKDFPMLPPGKALTGFDPPLRAPLNVDVLIKDRSLEVANCGANGFEGEDKDLDYILYCKGTERMLIPLSQVCQNVVLRPERAASNNGDESPSSQGAVAYPPTPLK
jgi:hypothetical protein